MFMMIRYFVNVRLHQDDGNNCTRETRHIMIQFTVQIEFK